jgi:hypothetical protein
VLKAVDVLDDIFTLVSAELTAHNLTLARIEQEVHTAWNEFEAGKLVDGNLAIARRHINGILADVTAFVRSIVDRVIEKVRSVIAKVAEPFLQKPEVKPYWDLARKVLRYDPLLGTEVSAPTAEIIGDFLRLIGKQEVLQQMQERGTLQQAADWLDTQLATFASIKNDLFALFDQAWQAIQPQNLPNLLSTLPGLADRAVALVRRIADFAHTVIAKALELIKQSLLGWLSTHAHQIPGFHLLTVIIEKNPFTGDRVPRTAENLIKGFITLLPNGEATYQQLAESGTIAEAAATIEGAMSRLGISTELITNTFLGIWNTLSFNDLLAPIAAFERILGKFREPLGRILEFVAEVIKVLITLILKLMNFPSDLLGRIIDNAMAAIEDIKRDPVAFLTNMLQALKAGVSGFLDGILGYLVNGLKSWLFRGLGKLGIEIPQEVTLQSILKLILQVLNITEELLWRKLGEKIGQEKVVKIRGAVDKLTGVWTFIKDIQEGGIGAIWRHVTDQLGNLWDSLLGMARDWIMREIVEKVTTRLLSMLDPTGIMAIVRSVQAFFNAVQSAIEYLRDILMIVDDYVTTFAQVAAGNIAPGAAKIQQGLANAIPIAIGFLANQIGLGNIPEEITKIIEEFRLIVEEAVGWLISKAVDLGQSALNALGFGDKPDEVPTAAPGDVRGQAQAALMKQLESGHTREQVAPIIAGIEGQFQPAGLKRIVMGEPDQDGNYAILIEASPLAPAVLMGLIPRGYSVRASATLTFSQEVTLANAREFRHDKTSGKKPRPRKFPGQPGYIMVASGDDKEADTKIVNPEPGGVLGGGAPEQITSDVIQMVSKNKSFPKNAKELTNDSHAETHLVEQLKRDVQDWNLLLTMHLDISRMPCAMCCATLADWLRSMPHVQVRITYDRTHPETLEDSCNFPTSEESLNKFRALPNVTLAPLPALFQTDNQAIMHASRTASPA